MKILFVFVVTFFALLCVTVNVMAQEEIIVNGTFDEDMNNWESVEEASWTDERDHTGNDGGAAYIGNEGCIYQVIDTEESGIFRLEAYVMADDIGDGVRIYIYADEELLYESQTTTPPTSTWAMMTPNEAYTETLPESDSIAVFFCTYVDSGIYIDDVTLEFPEEPTPTPEPTPSTPCPYGYIPRGTGCAAMMPLNDRWHVNSVDPEIALASGELPAPLPVVPAPAQLPALQLPYVNRVTWPTLTDERETIKILVRNRVNLLRQSLSTRYNSARLSVRSVRNTTAMVSDLIGNPMETTAHTGGRSLTLNAMAQEAAQSVEFALDYVRAVADIGPMGLNLVFAFVGLGWLVFVDLMSLIIRMIAWFIRMVGKVLDGIWKILIMLMEFIRLIVAIIDLFWPF